MKTRRLLKIINRQKIRIDITNQTDVKISPRRIRNIANMVLSKEKVCRRDPISIVFVNDHKMTEINQQYFNKNTPTDVISFNYNDEFPSEVGSPWGEVLVNADQVKCQALEYKVSIDEELARLVIHGLLHLTGYNDQTRSEKSQMREKENNYLQMLK